LKPSQQSDAAGVWLAQTRFNAKQGSFIVAEHPGSRFEIDAGPILGFPVTPSEFAKSRGLLQTKYQLSPGMCQSLTEPVGEASLLISQCCARSMQEHTWFSGALSQFE
jgi:hypothetical protein